MGAQYGPQTTLTATDKELYLNIEKEIRKYPAPRIEIIKRLKSFSQPVLSHKIEWSLRDNRPVKTTMAVAAASNATTLIVEDVGVFNVDDILQKPDGQQMVVTAVQGPQLTVEHLAGTAEAVDIGDEVVRVGMATPKGKDADNMVNTGYEDLYNYTSILEDVVELDGTANAALIRGQEDSGELIAKKHQELLETLQAQLVVGVRTKDDAKKRTTLGGFKFLIDTYAPDNAINFGGSSTWSGTGDSGPMGKIDDALDKIAAKAFDKPTLYVGAKFMRKFKYLMSDTIKTELSEDRRGIGVVGSYLSHIYGVVPVVLIQERHGIMDDLVIVTDESDAGYKAMRGREWQTFPLGRTGDSYRWQILGEYTFKLGNPEAHAYIYNLGV